MVSAPGANFPNFTSQENIGKTIFFSTITNGGGACFGCHTTEAFISANPGPQNNGIDASSTSDLGAGEVFNNPIFVGRFKAPSLRNIELTAPYMHDGRFKTIEEVIDFYSSGVQPSPTLDAKLKPSIGKEIYTEIEKRKLIAFLNTLNDYDFIRNSTY